MVCRNCGNKYFENGICTVCGQPAEAEVQTEQCSVYEEPAPRKDEGKIFGIISLVGGIISLLSGSTCTCLLSMLGGALPSMLAVVSVILGIVGVVMSKASGNKNIFGIIGAVLGVVTMVAVVVLVFVNIIAGSIIGATMYQ